MWELNVIVKKIWIIWKGAPDDHLKLTDAEILGGASSEASWDDNEAVEDIEEARLTLVKWTQPRISILDFPL